MLFSGTWGKKIHKKNLKQKILLHFPFKIYLAASWFANHLAVPHLEEAKPYTPS